MIELPLALAVCLATAWLMLREARPRHATSRRRARRPKQAPADPAAARSNGAGAVTLAETAEVVVAADEGALVADEPPALEAAVLDAIPGEEVEEAAPAISGEDWLVSLPDEPEPAPPPSAPLDPLAVAVPIASLEDPRAATAVEHPDYEIVELPTGPTILKIGLAHKRPDPQKLIQTEVLVRDGASARLWALTRLLIAVVSFGLAVGFGILLVKPTAAWIFRML